VGIEEGISATCFIETLYKVILPNEILTHYQCTGELLNWNVVRIISGNTILDDLVAVVDGETLNIIIIIQVPNDILLVDGVVINDVGVSMWVLLLVPHRLPIITIHRVTILPYP